MINFLWSASTTTIRNTHLTYKFLKSAVPFMSQPSTPKHLISNFEFAHPFPELDDDARGIAAEDDRPGEDEHARPLHEWLSELKSVCVWWIEERREKHTQG
jgi:hypothetical protein